MAASELIEALQALAHERKIDEFYLIDRLEASLAKSYQHILDLEYDARVTIDRNTGKIYVYELVPVGEPDEETGEYSEFEERDVTPDDVSRIAALNAKNVIGSIVRDAGRQSIYEEFSSRVGDLVTGTVLQGNFRAMISVSYEKGESAAAITPAFLVNATPPELSVDLSPRFFSPDNDGIDDELYIRLSARSLSPFARWSFEIREPEGTAGRVFWQTGGSGTITEQIIWDGRSNESELVQAATDYPFTFTVQDDVGMTSVVRGYIPVDVLVIRDGNNLKIAVPSIIFAKNVATFDGLAPDVIAKNEQILRRVAEILNRFKTYNVVIEGHANNVTGTEREDREELIPLSQARSDAIRRILEEYGVSSPRLSTVGMGGTRPVAAREDRDNWWKNRRVEFILIK